MRPHSIRRRQHLLKISHPPNFSSWRRHAIVWILPNFSIISQIRPHCKRYFCISSDSSYVKFGGNKTWHESKLDIIFVDKTSNSTINYQLDLSTQFRRTFRVVSGILYFLVLLSGDRCRDGSCLPRPQRVTGQGKIIYTGSAARLKNRPAARFSQLNFFRALGGGTWRHPSL